MTVMVCSLAAAARRTFSSIIFGIYEEFFFTFTSQMLNSNILSVANLYKSFVVLTHKFPNA